MSPETSLIPELQQARRPRIPLLVAAWTQLGIASPLLVFGGALLILAGDLYSVLLLLTLLLLICSGVSILLCRPQSWWVALLVQIPLLAYEVGLALYAVHALQTYQPQSDWHGVEPTINTLLLMLALLLGFCSLTALLYLLRTRTRESYGPSPTFRRP